MPPERCIACGTSPEAATWNGLQIRQCPSCGLAWRAAFDLAPEYYRTLHEAHPEVAPEKRAARLRNARDRLASVASFLPARDVCDIGAGDGSFLEVLREAGLEEAWGIEPSDVARAQAEARGLTVVQGDVGDEAARAARPMRAATLFHVLEHLPDPVRALKDIAGTLQEPGVLVIEVPDIEASLQRTTNYANSLINREHLFYWNERALSSVLAAADFRVVRVRRRSFDWKHAPIAASLARLGLRRFAPAPAAPAEEGSGEAQAVQPKALSGDPLVRRGVRMLLAYLVHLLGRDDYLLIVAERLY